MVALLTARGRFPRPKIVSSIDVIRGWQHLEIVHIDPSLDADAWALPKARPDKDWSLVDASSFVVMSQRGITDALTTGPHFQQAGFVRLLKP